METADPWEINLCDFSLFQDDVINHRQREYGALDICVGLNENNPLSFNESLESSLFIVS